MTTEEALFVVFSIPILTHKDASGLNQLPFNYPFLRTQYQQSLSVSSTVLTRPHQYSGNKYDTRTEKGKGKAAVPFSYTVLSDEKHSRVPRVLCRHIVMGVLVFNISAVCNSSMVVLDELNSIIHIEEVHKGG